MASVLSHTHIRWMARTTHRIAQPESTGGTRPGGGGRGSTHIQIHTQSDPHTLRSTHIQIRFWVLPFRLRCSRVLLCTSAMRLATDYLRRKRTGAGHKRNLRASASPPPPKSAPRAGSNELPGVSSGRCRWASGQSSVVHVSLCRCVGCALCENLNIKY
jgi:hypothetical protein